MARIELIVVLLGALLAITHGKPPPPGKNPPPPGAEKVSEDVKSAKTVVEEEMDKLDEELKKLDGEGPADWHEVLQEFNPRAAMEEFRDIIEDIKKGMSDMADEEEEHQLPPRCAGFADAVFRMINEEKRPKPEGLPREREEGATPGDKVGPPEDGEKVERPAGEEVEGPPEERKDIDLKKLLVEDLRCIERGMKEAKERLEMAKKEGEKIVKIEEGEKPVEEPVKRDEDEDEEEEEEEEEVEDPHRKAGIDFLVDALIDMEHFRAAVRTIGLAAKALENREGEPRGKLEGPPDASGPPSGDTTKRELMTVLEELLQKREGEKPKSPDGEKPNGPKPHGPKPHGPKPHGPKPTEDAPTKRNLDPLQKYIARQRP